MRIVIQRVLEASVEVGGEVVSRIDKGILVLVGIAIGDTDDDVSWLAAKTVSMRIFDDENGVMNKSVSDIDGNIIAVSQFTLNASTRKGNRPSYIKAARPEEAKPLYEMYCKLLENKIGKVVGRGVFGADMKVNLINDGPVTIIVDSKQRE